MPEPLATLDDVEARLGRSLEGDEIARVEAYLVDFSAVARSYTGQAFTEVPEDIRAVTCQVVIRALGISPEDSAVTQESLEGYSFSIGAAGAAGPLGLLNDERAVLGRYRLTWGVIRIDAPT